MIITLTKIKIKNKKTNSEKDTHEQKYDKMTLYEIQCKYDMTDLLTTTDRRISWINKYNKFKQIFESNISNMFWVYEECNYDYLNASNKIALSKMGCFSPHRLKHYVLWLHVICPSNELQAYAVKSTIGCHYQVTAKELFCFIQNNHTQVLIHIYGGKGIMIQNLLPFGTKFLINQTYMQ